MFENEGLFTLVKTLGNLPLEKQEEFLKSQNPQEGEAYLVRTEKGIRVEILEKGAKATSKRVSETTATQIDYPKKPESRVKIKEGGKERGKTYAFDKEKGEVEVSEGIGKEKKTTKKVPVSSEAGLKNASQEEADLEKAKGGAYTTEVAQDGSEDSIPDGEEGHVHDGGESTKTKSVDERVVDLVKSYNPDLFKEEHVEKGGFKNKVTDAMVDLDDGKMSDEELYNAAMKKVQGKESETIDRATDTKKEQGSEKNASMHSTLDSIIEKSEYGRYKGKPVVQSEAGHGVRAHSWHRGKEYQYDPDKGEINVYREKGTAPRKKLKTVPIDDSHEKELKNASLHTRLENLLTKAKYQKREQADSGYKYTYGETKREPKKLKQDSDEFVDRQHAAETMNLADREQWTIAGGSKAGRTNLQSNIRPKSEEIDDLQKDLEKGRKPKWEKKRSASEEGEVMHPGKASDYMGNPGGSEEKKIYDRTKSDSMANLKRLSESKDPHDRKAAAAGMKRHESD